MESGQIAQIDVRAMLRQKMNREPSRLLVWVIKTLVKQDWYNESFRKVGACEGVEWMVKVIDFLQVNLVVSGKENLPASGTACTFACNHPLGGVDVLSAVTAIADRYPEGILIPANDLLAHVPMLRPMIIPVNKVGGQSRELSEHINAAFTSSAQVMFFPAGKVSRKHPDGIYDDAWKKNFITKSVEFNRVVVPILIEARNSWLFYAVARVRKLLNIKLNIEMMLLPREVYHQRNKTIRVTIGKPIHPDTFTNAKSPLQWADEVRSQAYALAFAK